MKLLDIEIPDAPLLWKRGAHKAFSRPITPARKRGCQLIAVGAGSEEVSAAPVFGEQGCSVKCFRHQNRPHSALPNNRSFGSAKVSRTFYAHGQLAISFCLGPYSELIKEPLHCASVKLSKRSCK